MICYFQKFRLFIFDLLFFIFDAPPLAVGAISFPDFPGPFCGLFWCWKLILALNRILNHPTNAYMVDKRLIKMILINIHINNIHFQPISWQQVVAFVSLRFRFWNKRSVAPEAKFLSKLFRGHSSSRGYWVLKNLKIIETRNLFK